MAPWGNSGRRSDAEDSKEAETRRESWEDDNPFIAFRRFADEQFSTLVQGINSLPEILGDVRSKAEEQRQQWELRKEQDKWNAHAHEGDFRPGQGVLVASLPRPVNQESIEAARILLRQARNANAGVDPKKILELYRDVESFDSFKGGFGHHEPRWLSVDWFRNSPYSPARIEQHPHAHQHGSMWRAAFEDLLSEQMGKEMEAYPAWTSRVNNQKLYATWAQHPSDWMLGLQCRGILPPQLPALYHMRDTKQMDEAFSNILNGREQPRSRQAHKTLWDFQELAAEIAHFDADEREEQLAAAQRVPDTEQDLYESFLGNAAREAGCPAFSEPAEEMGCPALSAPVEQQQQQRPAMDVSTSKILSTLSTTERTTLPDGTVTTKVVLKKRFADGREESTETVSTSHAEQDSPTMKRPVSQSERAGGENDKKKGWFWN